ncbi:hypothetical protein LXA43DRAFT_1066673 [Ganoderma leucocontextum]|nr:hypothetical protein LXA43DRAFT_1066673 [Ganoderma leucocontextum]
MYFFKSFIAAAIVFLSVSLEASAHAAISPVLGVSGTPVRSDVQRPTNARPCGRTNVADTFETSDTITMDADNTFNATITNFNKGVDGSREIVSALVDVTGTGEQFDQTATVQENGTRNPKDLGSEQLTIALPQACSGGQDENKCLVSLKTAGGFGNCVVVQNAAANVTTSTSAVRRHAAPRRLVRRRAGLSRLSDVE